MNQIESQVNAYSDKVRSELKSEKVNVPLLKAIMKYMGPSIFIKETSLISTSDNLELNKIKTKFLLGKLGLKDSEQLDKTILKAADKFNKTNLNERVFFYYFLVRETGKESVFLKEMNKKSEKKSEKNLLDFGEKLIKKQKDIEPELKRILDNNFASLL